MSNRLKELREQKGLTQAELAKILLISQTGYSKYEVGTNDIPTKILLKLSEIYGESINYILGDDNF